MSSSDAVNGVMHQLSLAYFAAGVAGDAGAAAALRCLAAALRRWS